MAEGMIMDKEEARLTRLLEFVRINKELHGDCMITLKCFHCGCEALYSEWKAVE
jgi:hypothetical protein